MDCKWPSCSCISKSWSHLPWYNMMSLQKTESSKFGRETQQKLLYQFIACRAKKDPPSFQEPDKSTFSQVTAVSFVGIGSTNRHKSRPIQELNKNTALIQVQLPISSARRQNPPANGNWKQSRVCDLWLIGVTLVNYIHCFTNLQVK